MESSGESSEEEKASPPRMDLTDLPRDLWRYLFNEFAEDYRPVHRAVCRGWRDRLKRVVLDRGGAPSWESVFALDGAENVLDWYYHYAAPDKQSATRILRCATKRGHLGIVDWALQSGADRDDVRALHNAIKRGRTEILDALRPEPRETWMKRLESCGFHSLSVAARNGNWMALRHLHAWAPIRLDVLEGCLQEATIAGQITTMCTLREMGARPDAISLGQVARSGSMQALLLVIQWQGSIPVEEFDEALITASQRGHLGIMAKAREHGASHYNHALGNAAVFNRIEAMRLLKSWGGDSYDFALACAADGNHREAMELARAWGAQDYDQALVSAAIQGQLEAMKLLREWGAHDYRGALNEIIDTCAPAELLRAWIAEEGRGV